MSFNPVRAVAWYFCGAMFELKPLRGLIALACFVVAGASGCASTTYPATVRGATTREDRWTGGGPFAATIDGGDASGITVRVQPADCQTYVVTPVVTTWYSKPSTPGAIGLIGAGLAVAALGTASWLSASSDPAECAANDDSCVTRDQARGAGGLLWGLGGAGVVWGTVRLLQGPKVVSSKPGQEDAPTQDPTHPCGVSVDQVRVSLASRLTTLETETDEAGTARFPTCANGVSERCIDVARLSSGDQADLRAGTQPLGRVNLGQLVGATDPPPADVPSQTLTDDQKLMLAFGICAVKVWGMGKCTEHLGALACSVLEQALTGTGSIDPSTALQALAESKLGESSDIVQFLLNAKDLVVCANQLMSQ
jgi:hypothetical protein